LEVLNILTKFAQGKDVIICDFVLDVKYDMCQVNIFMMYFEPMIGYQCEHFEVFRDVVDNNSTTITQNWVINLNNISVETFAVCMVGHSYKVHIFNVVVVANQLACRDVFLASIAQVKTQCFIAIEKFITKLDRRFMDFELMNPWHCVSTILDAT